MPPGKGFTTASPEWTRIYLKTSTSTTTRLLTASYPMRLRLERLVFGFHPRRAKALGLKSKPLNSIDGYCGFSSGYAYTF